MSFSDEEIKDRIELVKLVVAGAYRVRCERISTADLYDVARDWERIFARIPTQELLELRDMGLQHRCKTPEQFINVWEMKTTAEFHRKATQLALKKAHASAVTRPRIPEFVMEEWGGLNG